MTQQQYTSHKTSRRQVPALHRALLKIQKWNPNTISRNLDVGGGRFEDATEALRQASVQNAVYDPYNRSDEHNEAVLSRYDYDTATVANVLNVIAERDVRIDVLRIAAERAETVYVTVYEGDKTYEGRPTRDGWQEHRPLQSYALDECREVFDSVFMLRIGRVKVIRCRNKKTS